jgi:hypothetical protein
VSLDALGSLALQVTFAVMGVPAILTRPDTTVVPTSVIWLEPILIDVPNATDLQRRESRRVAALSRTDVSSVPRGARIDAAERDGGVVQAWRVDQIDASDPDHLRAIVVPW